MGQKNDFNNQENVQSYFKNNKNVYEWWNPTTDHMANIYNYGLIKSVEYLENLLEKSNILDAACGKGRITKYLSAKFHVEACDINPYMVEHVKKLNLKNVNVRNADFADLPYEDNFFDAVFCFGALVHTLKLNEVFNEFNRVLKPEGILIIDFDNKYGFIRFFIDFFEILISFFDKKTRKRRQENRKIFFPLSEKNVTKLLSDHSFKIKNKFYLGFLPPFKICGRYILKKDLHLKYIKLFMLFDNIFMLKKASTYIYIICSKKKYFLFDIFLFEKDKLMDQTSMFEERTSPIA